LEVATWEIPPHPPFTKGGRGGARGFLDTLIVAVAYAVVLITACQDVWPERRPYKHES
jgi:hypothetical protein